MTGNMRFNLLAILGMAFSLTVASATDQLQIGVKYKPTNALSKHARETSLACSGSTYLTICADIAATQGLLQQMARNLIRHWTATSPSSSLVSTKPLCRA